MPASFVPSGAELFRFLPEIILSGAGTLIMVVEAASANRRLTGRICLGGLLAAMWGAVAAYSNPGPAFNGMLVIDGFGTFFRILVIAVGLLAYFTSTSYLERERAEPSEFYALLLFSIVGQCLMATADELMVIFIGLEISSIASYVLAGYLRDDPRNNESALKYFLLGSFASAFFLYGIAWIYGLTGSIHLTEIRRIIMTREIAPNMALVGTAAALMFVGFAFKISAAPFQLWAPDVYQGAPAPSAALVASASKLAGFTLFTRLLWPGLGAAAGSPASFGGGPGWLPAVAAIAAASLILGNLVALAQSNLRRLLAYSAIAHSGAMLLGVMAAGRSGPAPLFYYASTYGLATVGAFGVVAAAEQGGRCEAISDLAGLHRRSPLLASCLAVFILSLAGIPPLAGFFGKFAVFAAALRLGGVTAPAGSLAVLAIALSAVALYYYLIVLKQALVAKPPADAPPIRVAPSTALALVAAAGLIIALGLFPARLLGLF